MEKENFAKTANILIVVALPEEYRLLLERMPPSRDFSDDQHVISEHESGVGGYRIFSILSREMGDAAAMDATLTAIEYLQPTLIVCVGIAGSLSSDLKIGDVAVSNEVIDISQNIKISERKVIRKARSSSRKKKGPTKPERIEQVIVLSPKVMQVEPLLSASFRFVQTHPTLSEGHRAWVEEAAERRNVMASEFTDAGLAEELAIEPGVEIGPIISGPVVASPAFKRTLKNLDRKVVAVETESAGIFRAAARFGIQAVTIRGISDHADLDKNALERTTKKIARNLASINAIEYLKLQLNNPKFMSLAERGRVDRVRSESDGQKTPEAVLSKIEGDLHAYLNAMSPEYKHCPGDAILPIPRVSPEFDDENLERGQERRPFDILSALQSYRQIYIKIPKSFPSQTLAWSVAQSLLKGGIDGKQILPLVLDGAEIAPPSKGLAHATGIDLKDQMLADNFASNIVINEPPFLSSGKLGYLAKQLEGYNGCLVVISRAESPPEEIDRFKRDHNLKDFVSAPVPFSEIASYLETAFEMRPEEADSVASRLDDTFSKFRLHTHPAYFVGLQETALDALIKANQRGELIQLAVTGLLSFVVALDESAVKLSRTSREEFLSNLAFELRVEARVFSRSDLEELARKFGAVKNLEVQPTQFLDGFFKVGLLNDCDGGIAFSVPYLQAYLLAERLKGDPPAAERYFDPSKDDFDHFSFDLYVERGPGEAVVSSLVTYAKYALSGCTDEKDVYLSKAVKPKALTNSRTLLSFAKQMSSAVEKMVASPASREIRQEKQKLIDARAAVRGEVKSRDDQESERKTGTNVEFDRLDRLSRASTLLATALGSGAERLTAEQKADISGLILTVYERFLHYWTLNRMSLDFQDMRADLLSDEAIDKLIDDLGLYNKDRAEIHETLSTFIDDQEIRLLSGPAGALFNRLAQYAGVRSLRPIFSDMKPKNAMEEILRDVWLMDVEHSDGKRELKKDLSAYKGSDLLRLVIANHLMYRIFWHHWQSESRSAFSDVATYALAPMNLITAEEHQERMLEGHKRQ